MGSHLVVGNGRKRRARDKRLEKSRNQRTENQIFPHFDKLLGRVRRRACKLLREVPFDGMGMVVRVPMRAQVAMAMYMRTFAAMPRSKRGPVGLQRIRLHEIIKNQS